MNKGEAQVLIVDAQIFPAKAAVERQTIEDTREKVKIVNLPPQPSAIEKRDFSDVFARLKKSTRKKSAGIL